MINTIRADFYRLFRSWGFWITQAVLIMAVVGSILAQSSGKIGISVSTSTATTEALGYKVVWNGVQTLNIMSTMSTLLTYLCLSLFIITIGYDLSRGLLKNLLTSGVSRAQFFFSKYLVFLAVILVQFVFYYGLSFITASLLHGVGKAPSDFWGNFLGAFIMQFLFIQADFAIGLLTLYLTYSTVWPVLATIVVPMIIGMLGVFIGSLHWMTHSLDFQGNMALAMSLSHGDIAKLVPTAFAVILVLAGLAYWSFMKKDL